MHYFPQIEWMEYIFIDRNTSVFFLDFPVFFCIMYWCICIFLHILHSFVFLQLLSIFLSCCIFLWKEILQFYVSKWILLTRCILLYSSEVFFRILKIVPLLTFSTFSPLEGQRFLCEKICIIFHLQFSRKNVSLAFSQVKYGFATTFDVSFYFFGAFSRCLLQTFFKVENFQVHFNHFLAGIEGQNEP